MKVWLDTESRCRLDVRKVGAYRYCEDPSFKLLMCAYAIDDGPIRVAAGELELFEQLDPLMEMYDDPDTVYVAHNTGFDRVAIGTYLGLPPGKYLHPSKWDDTLVRARSEGFPGSLDKLTKQLGVTQKDSAGTRLINLFCKPNKAGGWNDETTHPEQWAEFKLYCGHDVEAMRDAAKRLPEHTGIEREVWIADQLINDRGVRVDLPMAQAALLADADNKASARTEVIELTGVDNPGSGPQMLKWFDDSGLPMLNLTKDTVTTVLEQDISPTHRRVLELRQELALTSAPAKFQAAVSMACHDGRVRGTASYYGAHTGRWSGRGIQLQNQPRASLGAYEALALWDLMNGFGASPKQLKALVRPLLLGPLTVVDYSQIEARVIAWLSGEQWVLDAFRGGRDIYIETAKRMGMADPEGAGRQSGKSAVLGLGFGGAEMALTNVGMKGTEDEKTVIVRKFRKANPNTVQLWYGLWDIFVRGGTYGRITVHRSKGVRRIQLPSGREIVYQGITCKQVERRSQRTGRTYKAWDMTSRQPTGKIARLWSGTITENIVQGTARDLLARALPELERRGLPTVAHIHDEAIVEGDHLEEVRSVMLDAPSWADGLPIDADGHVVMRYTK